MKNYTFMLTKSFDDNFVLALFLDISDIEENDPKYIDPTPRVLNLEHALCFIWKNVQPNTDKFNTYVKYLINMQKGDQFKIIL